MVTREVARPVGDTLDPLSDHTRTVEVPSLANHLLGILEVGMQRQKWTTDSNIGVVVVRDGLRAPVLELGGLDLLATVSRVRVIVRQNLIDRMPASASATLPRAAQQYGLRLSCDDGSKVQGETVLLAARDSREAAPFSALFMPIPLWRFGMMGHKESIPART